MTSSSVEFVLSGVVMSFIAFTAVLALRDTVVVPDAVLVVIFSLLIVDSSCVVGSVVVLLAAKVSDVSL